MNDQDIGRSIQRAWQYVKAVGIDELFSNPRPIVAPDAFKNLARDETAKYEDLYLEGLANGAYNILLADYAFLQFGGSDDSTLRYAYYPNPFLGASRQAVSEFTDLRSYVDEGVLDVDEFLHRVSEIRYTQHPPLLRYENSPSQHVDLVHPCSHLHIGHHAESRWPVRRVITPAAFTLLLLKLFYADFWKEGDAIPSGAKSLPLDEVLAAAKTDCALLPDNLFSRAAEQQFFIA